MANFQYHDTDNDVPGESVTPGWRYFAGPDGYPALTTPSSVGKLGALLPGSAFASGVDSFLKPGLADRAGDDLAADGKGRRAADPQLTGISQIVGDFLLHVGAFDKGLGRGQVQPRLACRSGDAGGIRARAL